MIYPINEMMQQFLDSVIDEETGEVTMTDEEMQEGINKLHMEFDEKILELRNTVINLTAEAEAIKAEKAKLDERKRIAENGAERAKRFLAWLLKGEKYKNGIVSISYRRSEKLEIEDKDGLRDWAMQNARGFLKEPELRESEIKQAVKRGEAIPFATIKENRSLIVR